MLISVGLDETRLNRRPWVSIAILVTCVLAFYLAGSLFSGACRRFDNGFLVSDTDPPHGTDPRRRPATPPAPDLPTMHRQTDRPP